MRLPSSFIADAKKKQMDDDIVSFKNMMRTTVPQRIPTKVWKEVLLRGEDTIIHNGQFHQFHGKNLGAGVWEISRPVIAGESLTKS